MSTHLLTLSPTPQPAKKLRPCLSPSRHSRSTSPAESHRMALGSSRSPSASSVSSVCTESTSSNGWYKRKCVRWQGDYDGCAVTSYFATYSATEYDRTPLAPPSEEERACVLPARGSRCLSTLYIDKVEEEEPLEECESEDDIVLPRSPFATPEDSDSEREEEDGGDEWSECFARRRMMFASMRGLESDGPQFEGYRSLSSTLADLLRSVSCDDDGVSTPRVGGSATPADEDEDGEEAPSSPCVPDLFVRLRESSTESDTVATPSLTSADSDGDCSGLASPDGSALDFLPGAPWKAASLALHRECTLNL